MQSTRHAKFITPLHKTLKGKKYKFVKKAKIVNYFYENIVNPIYLLELSNQYFANSIPLGTIIVKGFSQMLGGYASTCQHVYDTVTTSKEMSESVVDIARKKKKKNVSEVFIIIKMYLLLYKFIWIVLESKGVSKASVPVPMLMATLDVVNLFLSRL